MTRRIRKYWLLFSVFYYFAFFPLLNWISFGQLQDFLSFTVTNSLPSFIFGNFSSLLFGSILPFYLVYYFGYRRMGTRWLTFLCCKQVIKLFAILLVSFSFLSQELVSILFLGEFIWLYLCFSLKKFNVEWRQKEHIIPSSLLQILTQMDRASSYDELSRHYHHAVDLWPHYFQQIHKHFSKIRDRVVS